MACPSVVSSTFPLFKSYGTMSPRQHTQPVILNLLTYFSERDCKQGYRCQVPHHVASQWLCTHSPYSLQEADYLLQVVEGTHPLPLCKPVRVMASCTSCTGMARVGLFSVRVPHESSHFMYFKLTIVILPVPVTHKSSYLLYR